FGAGHLPAHRPRTRWRHHRAKPGQKRRDVQHLSAGVVTASFSARIASRKSRLQEFAISFPDEVIRVDGVAAEGRLGSGLEREAEGDGEIRRAGAVVHHPESQGAGPTPQVAVEGVK